MKSVLTNINNRQIGKHLLLLENGQAPEQDPMNNVPEQHQAASLHATHTIKTIHEKHDVLAAFYNTALYS